MGEKPAFLTAGVGVDLCCVSQLQALMERTGEVFAQRVFTPRERQEALASPEPAVYWAGRYAAKEAVFKAVAPLLPEKSFDLRLVETLRREDGSPWVQMEGPLADTYRRAGVDQVLVSISGEGDMAVAVALAGRLPPEPPGKPH